MEAGDISSMVPFPPTDTSYLELVILNCLFAIITTVFIFLCIGGCNVVQFFKSGSNSVKEYCGKTCAGLVVS